MSLILFSLLAAAAASLGGAVAARRIARRRAAERSPAPAALPAADAARTDPALAKTSATDALRLNVGDVIQHEMATRWPQGALIGHDNRGVQLAILLSSEDGVEQATVAFAPPDRSILWLRARPQSLPGQPPSRIELDGALLDRQLLLSLTIEARGDAPSELAGDAVVAIYGGSVGDSALLLDHPSGSRLWHGERLDEDDYERLANVPSAP